MTDSAKRAVGAGRLDQLSRRAEELKAALREMQARRRAQERIDGRRLEALVGRALVADVEAVEGEARVRRQAYIIEVLAKVVSSDIEIAFLKSKSWL